jgi:hypothetical protein
MARRRRHPEQQTGFCSKISMITPKRCAKNPFKISMRPAREKVPLKALKFEFVSQQNHRKTKSSRLPRRPIPKVLKK